MSLNPFKEILPTILVNKKSIITKDNENEYLPFIINKALSYHVDTVLYANEMNKNGHLSNLMQYQYLLNTIRPYKREFRAWYKKGDEEDLIMIKELFNISKNKAREALSLLSEEEMIQIRDAMYKGGTDDITRRANRGKT